MIIYPRHRYLGSTHILQLPHSSAKKPNKILRSATATHARKLIQAPSLTCSIISFTSSATPPPNSPVSAAMGRRELGYSRTSLRCRNFPCFNTNSMWPKVCTRGTTCIDTSEKKTYLYYQEANKTTCSSRLAAVDSSCPTSVRVQWSFLARIESSPCIREVK